MEAVERLRADTCSGPYRRRNRLRASHRAGEKTGYIVIFKTESIADPTAKGRAERAMRAKNAVAEEMPAELAS